MVALNRAHQQTVLKKSVNKTSSLIAEKIINLDNLTAVGESGKIYPLPKLNSRVLPKINLFDRHVFFANDQKRVIATDQEARFALDDGTDYFFQGSFVGEVGNSEWKSLSGSYVSPRFLGKSDKIIYLYRNNDWLIQSLSTADFDGKNWINLIELKDNKFINGIVYPSPNDRIVIFSLIDQNYTYYSYYADLEKKMKIQIDIKGLITSVGWLPNSQTAILTTATVSGKYQDRTLSPLYLYNLNKNVTRISDDKLTHCDGFSWLDQDRILVAWNDDINPESGNQTLAVFNIKDGSQKVIISTEHPESNPLRITYPQYLNGKIFFLNGGYLNAVEYKP